jgi:hypothetical protein
LNADRLISLGRSLIVRIEADATPVEAAVERVVNGGHVPLVSGLAHHSLRLGAVVLDLYENGRRLEAMPTIRALYETALTVAWLSQSREAISAFANEDVRQRKALSKSLAESSSEVFQSSAEKIAHLDQEEDDTIARPQATSLEQLCTALSPGGKDAYSIYRAMSASVHPSITVADNYVDVTDIDGAVTLLKHPEQPDHLSWLHLTVSSMVWSMRALDHMDRRHTHRSYLRSLARTLGVAETLDLTEKARAAETRAASERRRRSWRGPRRKKRGSQRTPG